MKALQKASKFLSDYTSAVVIAIAVVTFLLPGLMGWVNYQLFTDMVGIFGSLRRNGYFG